ncbi:MAG: pentapeptide repeat-containing protein [Microcoleus sp.]
MSVKFFAATIGLLATFGLVYQDSFKEFFFADSSKNLKQTTTNQSHVKQSLEKVAQVQHPEEVREILETKDCRVCQIDGINLSGANLPGANFWSSSLREANFSGSNLAGANFNEADLTGANFRGANLKGANFKKANLSHADLTNAQLENASLEDAILFAANLEGANLRGANLRGTQLPSQIISEPSNGETARSPQSGDVKTIAKEITVRIDYPEPSGSGVIIAKEGNIYYVLTAAHVMCEKNFIMCKDAVFTINIFTPEGSQKEKLNFNTVKKLPGVDLAVFSFTSSKKYRVARLANSDRISGINGTPVYVSGWPESDNSYQLSSYVFSGGKIADNSLGSVPDGYSLSYDNATLPGMSGGPVLDADGRVVAIHGQGFNQEVDDKEGNQDLSVKLELNLGIPINAFLQLAPKSGINLRVQIDSSQPPESARRSVRVPIASESIKNPNTRTAKAVILANKGFDLLVGKQLQQALTTFEQAIQIQPDLHSAWYGKARTLEALNRNQEALVALDKTIQLQRNFYYALQARGDLLRGLNRREEAIASYNQIINDKPQDNLYLHRLFQPHAYVMRGATRYDLGDREGAIADYGQAIAINQDFARAYYFRASVYLEMRNKQLAIKDFKAAAERYLAQGNVEGYQKTRQLLSFIDR